MLALLTLIACSGDGATADADSGTRGVGADTGATTSAGDTGDSTSDSAVLLASVSGRTVGTAGEPLEGLRITLCRGACQYDDTLADGSFSIPEVLPEIYPILLEDFTGEQGLAHPLFLVELVGGVDLVLPADVVIPPLADPVPVPDDPGEVELLPGFFLDVVPEELALWTWEPADHLLAARAPDVPVLVPFEEVLGTWYLAPTKSFSFVDMGLRIANEWGLAAGAQARAWVCGYDEIVWVDGGLLTVSDDAAWLTGGGITEFTTLVLVGED